MNWKFWIPTVAFHVSGAMTIFSLAFVAMAIALGCYLESFAWLIATGSWFTSVCMWHKPYQNAKDQL